MPVICLQPSVKLRENDGFARNAQWALLQYHPWKDRRERFLATDDNGEPLEKEYVKQYLRKCPGISDSNISRTTNARCEA